VPPAFANITWKVYIVFGVFCLAMFIHVLFLFPETSQKPLEEVEEIFDDTTPGSFRYLGTPAWKTHVNTHTRRMERGEMDAEEKFGREVEHEEATRADQETATDATKTEA
jgi:Sugar (and other) transporter